MTCCSWIDPPVIIHVNHENLQWVSALCDSNTLLQDIPLFHNITWTLLVIVIELLFLLLLFDVSFLPLGCLFLGLIENLSLSILCTLSFFSLLKVRSILRASLSIWMCWTNWSKVRYFILCFKILWQSFHERGN